MESQGKLSRAETVGYILADVCCFLHLALFPQTYTHLLHALLRGAPQLSLWGREWRPTKPPCTSEFPEDLDPNSGSLSLPRPLQMAGKKESTVLWSPRSPPPPPPRDREQKEESFPDKILMGERLGRELVCHRSKRSIPSTHIMSSTPNTHLPATEA